MANFTVSSAFPVGTAGTVVFRRKEWLTDAGGALIPPSDVTATLAGSPPAIAQSLRASEEEGVSPDFTYEVFIRLTGHNEMRGTLYLTANCDLSTALQFTTPHNPDLFVSRAEFEDLVTATGDPASQAALDAEEAARIAADEGLDERLTEAEAAITAVADHEARIVALEEAVTALLARGYVVNTDGEDDTLYIGETDPDLVDPPLDPAPAEGSAWWDTTEAP